MRNLLFLFVLMTSSYLSFSQDIIPEPVSMQKMDGSFSINSKTVILAEDPEDIKAAKIFNGYLWNIYGFNLPINKKQEKNFIRLVTKKFIKAPDKPEAYQLSVAKNGISISGDSYAGTFYGIQSLIQLLPENFASEKYKLDIPLVSIEDYPRFPYRGMHLDVCRHFFPISFIKKYIDYIALHKMNYFHWHLTDDQGWRIEIKKYPKLTSVAAWRNGTIVGRYPGTANDNIRYGGFYTQEEIKEVVRFAMDRHITVIPEIEMPGHSSAAIAAYPWLSCFPEQETNIPSHPSEASQNFHGKKVQETWGVFDDVYCAGNDSTFMFLQDVMDEVLALFPSQYIHVGGDESPKTNWKKCPRCQQRIKDLGLKDEHELQSYFIQRMEKYLNSKGRTLIGWDEILEGGLAPNAWVMSWRGEQGGVDAANQNHKVIMTPGEYVYLDHSQTKHEDSVVIGGYTPIEKVYAYEPVPKELSDDKASYIQGAQGNVWTEYMAYPSKVEYMIFPRMSALSEVLWSPKEKRDWNDFEKRLQTQFKRYSLWRVNYSKAYFDLQTMIMPAQNNAISYSFSTKQKGLPIYYDASYRDGKGKNYEKIFTNNDQVLIDKTTSTTLTLKKQQEVLNTVKQDFFFNKATGKNIRIKNIPNEKYPGQGGAFSLVNGVYSNKGLSYPDWLGWIGDDLEADIDLGKPTDFDSVRIHTLEQNGSWIYLPQYVEIQTSHNGIDFISAGKSSGFVNDTLTMGWINVMAPKQKVRYIKIIAKNYGLIPDGKPGAGNKAWLFADEIQIF